MNVLKDLTRQVSQPVPDSVDSACDVIKFVLLVCAAICALQIFGLVVA